MKFVFTPNPYIHKELVVGHEAGVLGRLEYERQTAFDPDTNIWKYNPVGKITALELDGGTSIFGGLLVCEYLDSLSAGRRLFPQDDSRWKALRLMMLGDALFNANAAIRVEIWFPEDRRRRDYMLRERRKIMNALDTLEREVDEIMGMPFNIGHICIGGAFSYIDLRNTIAEVLLEAGDDSFKWRAQHPKMAGWYDRLLERPSFAFSVDDLRNSPKARQQLAEQNDPNWERNGTTIGPDLF
jgi:glutathione S-transferase